MGDRDSIYGFAALGLDTFPVTDPVEAAKQLRRLAEGDYAVVYITEALAAQLETEIDRYRASASRHPSHPRPSREHRHGHPEREKTRWSRQLAPTSSSAATDRRQNRAFADPPLRGLRNRNRAGESKL